MKPYRDIRRASLTELVRGEGVLSAPEAQATSPIDSSWAKKSRRPLPEETPLREVPSVKSEKP